MGQGASRSAQGAVMALVMALALAGCTAIGGATSGAQSKLGTKSGAQAQAHTTATVATALPKLPWRVVNPPAGATPFATSFGVSQVNGREAWACSPATNGQYSVWRTQEAATWTLVSALSPAPQPNMSCSVSPNQGDANAVAINFTWGAGNAIITSQQGSVSYYSSDGGANWERLPANTWVTQVATVGATTYAELLNTAAQTSVLVVSGDQMATWSSIAEPVQNAQAEFQFWTASTPGVLLWADKPGDTFISADGGTSWQPVTAPSSAMPVQVTQAEWLPNLASDASYPSNTNSAGWLICGYAQQTSVGMCTADDGAIWKTYPPLKDTWECAHCAQGGGPSSGVNPCFATAIDGDGALYADCGNDPQDTTNAATWTILRLSPGAAAKWAPLGHAPSQDVTFTQTGQVWRLAPMGQSIYVLDQLP